MPEFIINGIEVNFPFDPYDVQKTYMSKLIESLENGTNAVLESPTGTGKTLCLLCATLAWIVNKKAKAQLLAGGQKAILRKEFAEKYGYKPTEMNEALLSFEACNNLNSKGEAQPPTWDGVPKVIYATRTHSQLSQAVQELKRSSYSFMKAVVLGSRDQLCIHPEVSKETDNSSKILMCKLRVDTRTCSYYNEVDKQKDNPVFKKQTIMDIEDLVLTGSKLRMCPYYASKELVQDADITFMPYNYLLDPKARRANKVELNNTIIILDEAHNVEKICEESASIQIKSSDVAVCIDDVTQIMKIMTDDVSQSDVGDEPKDFTIDDLVLLKEMLLELEKVIDEIEIINKIDGVTFDGGYIFELLSKAGIMYHTHQAMKSLLDSLLQFLSVGSQKNAVLRKGRSLQILSDLLTIVFSGSAEDKDKIIRSFKVHIQVEEVKSQKTSLVKDGWITTNAATTTKTAKVINYWCFNPGFGMEQLLNKSVRSVILTSGTLAPLKPLIAELAIPIAVQLENPHIVSNSQVCVKIVSSGPDKEPLNSNYRNRDNPKYVSSLGRTILSFCPVIPDGLLVFFPSYPVMNKCIDCWQASGIWTQITRHKSIFVEPRSKDAFVTTMNDFYTNINDPSKKGACFMAVCRGKVSEGLDFADMNGRAVIITGLPYPPLKDPRVILKKQYLEDNRSKENELLSGANWYALEATRAVNQAIGRVIRHKNDYGAILLCDNRFNQPNQKSQLSKWIQGHLNYSQQHQNFGPVIGEVSRFFRNAERNLPKPVVRENTSAPCNALVEGIMKKPSHNPANNFHKYNYQTADRKIENANEVIGWDPRDYNTSNVPESVDLTKGCDDFLTRINTNVSVINFNEPSTQSLATSSLVGIHKRDRTSPSTLPKIDASVKKRKLRLVPNHTAIRNGSANLNSTSISSDMSNNSMTKRCEDQSAPSDRTELLKVIKCSISKDSYKIFVQSLMDYNKTSDLTKLLDALFIVFNHENHHYLLNSMRRFVKEGDDKCKFDEIIQNKLN